jgi:hypothetical protein
MGNTSLVVIVTYIIINNISPLFTAAVSAVAVTATLILVTIAASVITTTVTTAVNSHYCCYC